MAKKARPRAQIVEEKFAANDYMEMLIKLRGQNRKTFDTLSPALRYSVSIYEANKRRYEQNRQAA
jgi:hypothetical protein